MKIKYFALMLAAVLTFTACNNDDDSTPSSPTGPTIETGNWCGTLDEYTITVKDMIDLITTAVPDIADYVDLFADLLCDVNVAKIKYTTTDPDGNIIEASGFITYPSKMEEYDHILSVQHGTMDVNGGPTDQVFPIETLPVFNGEFVVMADYLGYGVSKTKDLKNTYMHAKTTGTACADMLQAARQYLDSKTDLECINDDVRLIGYSQGGQATIATLFELERRGLGEQISLVWAGAGPYDMVSFLNESIKNPTSRKNAYIVHSIEGVINGDRLTFDKHNIYAPEMFENGKDSIFSKCYLSEWPDIIGADIHKILHEDFFKENYGGDHTDVHKLMEHMRSNSVVNIKDKLSDNVLISLHHNPDDTYVPYCCAESANEKWEDNSELIDLYLGNDHPASGAEFLFDYMGEKYLWLELILVPIINDVIN